MNFSDSQPRLNTGKKEVSASKTVISLYSAIDKFYSACGLFDLTEGMYGSDTEISYEQAQANQLDHLLDQIRCEPGHRVLDIGCGYGTLLERILQRGAAGVGITISPEQFKYCRQKHLDVYLLDYRAIPINWDRTFDGVIANGSIEHFVQPTDAALERQEGIYRHLFAAVHRLIDPNSNARRFATTTIHFVRKPADPLDTLRNPLVFRWGSDNFHWAVLARGWGGFYPEFGQLRRCADKYFDLIKENDGTEDYRLTSEEWLRRSRRASLSPKAIKIAYRSLPVLFRSPGQFLTLLLFFLFSESWNWQFRPPNPPTRLLRQTWVYRDRD